MIAALQFRRIFRPQANARLCNMFACRSSRSMAGLWPCPFVTLSGWYNSYTFSHLRIQVLPLILLLLVLLQSTRNIIMLFNTRLMDCQATLIPHHRSPIRRHQEVMCPTCLILSTCHLHHSRMSRQWSIIRKNQLRAPGNERVLPLPMVPRHQKSEKITQEQASLPWLPYVVLDLRQWHWMATFKHQYPLISLEILLRSSRHLHCTYTLIRQ